MTVVSAIAQNGKINTFLSLRGRLILDYRAAIVFLSREINEREGLGKKEKLFFFFFSCILKVQGEISTWRWVSHARFSIRREMLAHIPYQRDLFPRASNAYHNLKIMFPM